METPMPRLPAVLAITFVASFATPFMAGALWAAPKPAAEPRPAPPPAVSAAPAPVVMAAPDAAPCRAVRVVYAGHGEAAPCKAR